MTWLPLHYWLAFGAVILIVAGVGMLLTAAADYQTKAAGCRNPGEYLLTQREMFAGLGHAPSAVVRRARTTDPVDIDDMAPTLSLFGVVRQHHRPTPQTKTIYGAIVAIRKAGHKVEPRGKEHHAIDGEQVDRFELVRRARGLS